MGSLRETNEICGLEMLVMISAAIALGEQLKGSRMLLFLAKNAAAGAPIKAFPRIRAILASIESFWEREA